MNYREKLLDPRWQKKKSEIMTRDNFTCQQCGAKYKTLHVHHLAYKRCHGDPWGCPDSDLITLCEDCHQSLHETNKIERVKDYLIGTVKRDFIVTKVDTFWVERDLVFEIYLKMKKEPFYKTVTSMLFYKDNLKRSTSYLLSKALKLISNY